MRQNLICLWMFLQLLSPPLFSENKGCNRINQTGPCIPQEFENLSYAVYPDSNEYNTDRLNYNKLFNYFPKVIFYPSEASQVQFLVKTFKKYDLNFSIRSGGHWGVTK